MHFVHKGAHAQLEIGLLRLNQLQRLLQRSLLHHGQYSHNNSCDVL